MSGFTPKDDVQVELSAALDDKVAFMKSQTPSEMVKELVDEVRELVIANKREEAIEKLAELPEGVYKINRLDPQLSEKLVAEMATTVHLGIAGGAVAASLKALLANKPTKEVLSMLDEIEAGIKIQGGL